MVCRDYAGCTVAPLRSSVPPTILRKLLTASRLSNVDNRWDGSSGSSSRAVSVVARGATLSPDWAASCLDGPNPVVTERPAEAMDCGRVAAE